MRIARIFFAQLFAFLMAAGSSLAQNVTVSDIVRAVTKVDALKKGRVISLATGFFYQSGENRYFVTNRHVVKPPADIDPDHLRLLLHTQMWDLVPSLPLELPLYTAKGQRLWKEHPFCDADLIMLPLGEATMRPFVVHWIHATDIVNSEFPVSAGETVFVIGYPEGLYDEEHNLPIFRHAMIATAYGVDFQKHRMCLIDANLQHGMSGSPIFMEPTLSRMNKDGRITMFNGGFPTTLLGILSQWQPTKQTEELGVQPINIGLCNCWYPQLLEEIAKGDN